MINFLVWYNPATWFDDVSDGLFGALFSGIRLLFSMISTMLYRVMITLYNIFDVLCSARLLDNEILDKLSARVGLILGLIMLFYVIFSFIKLLLDPDAITDKTKGAIGIVKRVLIVIVMLGVASFAFRTLFSLQVAIVKNHVISKLVLPYDTDTDKFGNALAAELFTSFYRVDRAFYDDTGALSSDWANNSDVVNCERVVWTLKDQIYEKGDFSLTNTCLNEVAVVNNPYTGDQQETIIDFNWLFMIGVGIAVDYFLISYCIAVGVRMIRLAVLEIISPMAFVSYLAPKQDTMFSKWLKTYFSTYLDVFIRIGIISFAAFLCVTIMDTSGGWEFWNTVNNQPELKNYIIAFMIVALLTFAKKAPDLLKDLGFSGGAFGGFHLKDAFGLTTAYKVTRNNAGRAIGIGVGGAVNAGMSAIDRFNMARQLGKSPGKALVAGLSGIGSGLGHGISNGIKNKGQFWKNIPAGFKAQHESDESYQNLIAGGGSVPGSMYANFMSHIGGETKGQAYTRMLQNLDKIDDFKKRMYAAADEAADVKSAKDTWEQMHQNAGEDEAKYEARKSAAYTRYKELRNAFVDAAMENKTTYSGKVMNDDDRRYATDVQAIISEASSFSTSHNVKRWNPGTQRYEKIGPISKRTELADASNYAHETRTYITSRKDYQSAIANDKAAGVPERGRKNS